MSHITPLNDHEIITACATLKAHLNNAPLYFATVETFETGNTRQAELVVFNKETGETHIALVDLARKSVVKLTKRDNANAPYGQPVVIISEFFEAEAIVKADSCWRHAMSRRGLSEDEIALIQVDPFSAGYFGREVEKGKRLVSCVSYYRENLKDNGYAHPIEGVVALVDLIGKKIVHLVDDAIIPIPKTKYNYNRESLPKPRTDLKPLDIVQKEGVSFKVEGWKVTWQNWSFDVGYTPREGLVLHNIETHNRSVIRRASINEMVVPYADPTANHFWKNAFDAGEYGLGKLANVLELGCDCLGAIHYFDIPTFDDEGNAGVLKNAVCLHEEDYGTLWKHYEFRNDTYEMRRSRRLVISFFATVGNYDYGFYWYFYQDGTIQCEAKLTGIIQTAAIHAGSEYKYGGLVTPDLGGPTHQHFFNARLHMAVDGAKNTVSEHEFKGVKTSKKNPHGNVFEVTSKVLKREKGRKAKGKYGRYWKINSNVKNAVGKNTAYKLAITDSPLLMAQKDSFIHKRAGFATKHVWVTKYARDERYAAGMFPNQNAGDEGLRAYIKQKRSIENEELVIWHTFGHTHVCKGEDFPVMPVEYAGFMLKPSGFFDSSPAMDLPANGADGSSEVKGCCC
jgi:primary-amine oxidase